MHFLRIAIKYFGFSYLRVENLCVRLKNLEIFEQVNIGDFNDLSEFIELIKMLPYIMPLPFWVSAFSIYVVIFIRLSLQLESFDISVDLSAVMKSEVTLKNLTT